MRWGWGVRGFDGSCEGKSEVYLERILVRCRNRILKIGICLLIKGLYHVGHMSSYIERVRYLPPLHVPATPIVGEYIARAEKQGRGVMPLVDGYSNVQVTPPLMVLMTTPVDIATKAVEISSMAREW